MSLMPDVTELLHDPDLGAHEFTILRRTGKWYNGRFNAATSKTIQATGIMVPPTAEQLATLPEGERRKGAVAIYSETQMHLTEGEDIADDVTWLGEQYKVIHVDRWDEYGFWIAYAQKR